VLSGTAALGRVRCGCGCLGREAAGEVEERGEVLFSVLCKAGGGEGGEKQDGKEM